MLIEIDTKNARLGMYVHAVDGGWLASPFWRAQLVLSKQSEIDKLVKAGIMKIVIDTSKGVGPAEPVAPAPVAVEETPVEEAPVPVAVDAAYAGPERRTRKRVASELDRARATVERSKEAVSRMFAEVRMGHAVDAADVSPLVDEIAESVARDATAMLKVTRLKNKDEYTYLHSVAVCALMINFARRLNLPEEEVRDLGMAGLLHDIGKMSVPSALLEKPGALEPGERRVVQSHPEQGHQLLSESHNVSPAVLDVCLHHHERIDGTGYPHRLTGEQLTLHARMSAICDVYDAVTSNRPYKRPWSPSEALARMRSWEGHFDPALFAIFIESIGIYPVGGLVRMGDNVLALVIEGNDEDPTAPRVRCFYDIPAQAFVAHRDIATGSGTPQATILRSERGEHWFGDGWTEVQALVEAGTPDATGAATPRRAAMGG
ncbi:HD-GYP domain-containing protein [Sphingomonas adhaesiva]|uniref:HD-GYP domain-containing protein n=1 Tax=Sphingomonas adhaesiva TaxID=28212 RepID=UPI002FF55C87